MKLDITKKITLGVLAILVISAIISVVPKIIAFHRALNRTPKNYTTNEKMSRSFSISARRYKAYKEIFSTNKPILIYGYTTGALNDRMGKPFHEKLSSRLDAENIDMEVIAFKNWKNKKKELEIKYINNTSSCMMSKVQEDLEEYLGFIDKCMNSTCIISSDKRRYVYIVGRDPEYIIQIAKEYSLGNYFKRD